MIMSEKVKMHVNLGKPTVVRSTACTSRPPAATSRDAAIGRLSSQNTVSQRDPSIPLVTHACALNVPCADRAPASGVRCLRGLGLLLASAVFVAAVVRFAAALAEAIS